METGVKQKAQKKAQEPVNQLDEQTPRWFALYTMAKREKMVTARLAQKEITCYLPLLHQTRYYTRKIKQVELPLIRGYVFVRITKKEYVPVLETPDVVNFVKFNKNLIAIPEEEIDIIRRVVGDAVQAEAEPISFEPGDEVEIIGGQLTGIRGKLVSRENKREVLLELTTIGLALRVTVKEEYLRRI